MMINTCPITPLPLTVSKVPERLKIRQCRSRNCTESSPKFSRRMQYRHCIGAKFGFINIVITFIEI